MSQEAPAHAAPVHAAPIQDSPVNETPVHIDGGRIYLPRAAFERHFSSGVILLREGSDLMVLPVRQAAGGYLAKLRNSAGDRVVVAPDFFRAHGMPDTVSWRGQSAWSEERAALVCHGFFLK